ncbi:hypothetical protein [Streptomyces sp. NPDC053048]|uniref:hypothetical protein n=1 Tax=Streptomyces sp. NPDC053048 TaxID=3365694 RepID=UPI0037D11872
MGKSVEVVARIGSSEKLHAIRGDYQYGRTDNQTMCGRTGITGVEHRQSGAPIQVTCEVCAIAGFRWIVYLYVADTGRHEWELERAENLAEARALYAEFCREQGTLSCKAFLYPFTPEDWRSAETFRGLGNPFDHPDYVIERGPRGGVQVKAA